MSRRPNILYVCPCWPVDMAYGGQLRALHIGRALKQFGDVWLMVVNAISESPDAVARTSAEFQLAGEIKGAASPTSYYRKLRRATDPGFDDVQGILANERERALFGKALEGADIVWFLKLRSANIFGRWHWPRSVMDIDDLPSTYSMAKAKSARNPKAYLTSMLNVLIERRRERLLQDRFSVLSVCSQSDKLQLGFSARVHVIPNGFERPAFVPRRQRSQPLRIGFMGLYAYEPNYKGVEWFLRNCWESIREAIPDVRMRVVGKGSDGVRKPIGPGVDGLGWIEDAGGEISTWSLMIVPILTGAGTRIKIVDAFSRKCPVVSTHFGAAGYDLRDGHELRLADSPSDFASACIVLIRDQPAANAMADRAHTAFLEKWTWDAISPKVWAAAEDCLRNHRNHGLNNGGNLPSGVRHSLSS